MAVKDIIQYLEANKAKFSPETLMGELRKSGYPQDEINEAFGIMRGAPPLTHGVSRQISGRENWKIVAWWIGGFVAAAIVFIGAAILLLIIYLRAAFGGGEEGIAIILFLIAGGAIAAGLASFFFLRKSVPYFSYGILVATIIAGILALIGVGTVGMSFLSLGNARLKSRDARRVSDIKQIQLALELYYDAYSSYPDNLDMLSRKYIPAIPRDPQRGAYYYYERKGSGGYYMRAELENPDNSVLSYDVNPGNTFYEVEEKIEPLP